MAASDRQPPAQRGQFRQFLALTPRWKELDAIGHVNNAEIYGYFDSAIVEMLVGLGAITIGGGTLLPMLAESGARFHSELRFRDRIEIGVAVETIGNSSVRYRVAAFREGEDSAASDGFFVHVFVERNSRKPTPLPAAIRQSLEALK